MIILKNISKKNYSETEWIEFLNIMLNCLHNKQGREEFCKKIRSDIEMERLL